MHCGLHVISTLTQLLIYTDNCQKVMMILQLFLKIMKYYL